MDQLLAEFRLRFQTDQEPSAYVADGTDEEAVKVFEWLRSLTRVVASDQGFEAKVLLANVAIGVLNEARKEMLPGRRRAIDAALARSGRDELDRLLN